MANGRNNVNRISKLNTEFLFFYYRSTIICHSEEILVFYLLICFFCYLGNLIIFTRSSRTHVIVLKGNYLGEKISHFVCGFRAMIFGRIRRYSMGAPIKKFRLAKKRLFGHNFLHTWNSFTIFVPNDRTHRDLATESVTLKLISVCFRVTV